MPFIIADRVRETSTTAGTGNITLGGAVTGFQTFASVMATADTTYYTIADQSGPNWEVGIGTFTAPSTLARTTILSSSNGGSIVNFGAGTKDVFITLPASRTNVEDQPNLIEVNSSSAALRITQTGAGNALLVEDSANPDSSPFVVDTSGNVGVGTLSPTARLTVNGDIQVQSVNRIAFFDPNYFVRASSGLELQSGDIIRLLTSGTNERMRIDAAGQVQVGAGSAAAPALSTLADTNTGISFPAADTVAIVEGGVEALRINSSAQAEFTAGTPSLPSITTTGDTNTGIYFPDADTVAITTNGAEDFRIGPAGQIGLQGANYGSAGQVLTSNGGATAPSWQTISGGVTSFNSRTGAVTLSSGDVTGALGYTPMNSTNTTFSSLTVSSTAPTINMVDTDNITRFIHTNGNLIGFLSNGGGWTMYNDNSGSIWTPVYGWLQDFFFNNVSNCVRGEDRNSAYQGAPNCGITDNCYNCGDAQPNDPRIKVFTVFDGGGNIRLGAIGSRYNCACNC